MEIYSVEILNPKAVRLLEDLADLDLIAIKPETPAPKLAVLTEEQRAEARERVMRGAPTLDVDAMLEWLKESRKDRKLPFHDDE